MSLGELVEAVAEALSMLDELIGGLLSMPATNDDDSSPDNRPPITPSAKAIETWPTESQREHDSQQQPFQGHPKPLGGDL